nr:hypothetical protein [Candidatus Freyarchaeota archaeon]
MLRVKSTITAETCGLAGESLCLKLVAFIPALGWLTEAGSREAVPSSERLIKKQIRVFNI